MLGVEGTGALAFALWIGTIATTVADFGVPSSLARYLPELTARREAQQASGLVSFLFRRYVLGLLTLVLVFLALAAWTGIRGLPTAGYPSALGAPVSLALIGLLCLVQGLGAFATGYLKGVQRFDSLARLTIVSLIVQLTAVAIGSSQFGLPGALAGYAAGGVILAVVALRHGRTGQDLPLELRVRVGRYALYTWAAGIAAAFVWARIEIAFLERSWGHEAVGLFTIGLTLSSMATQGPMLLTAGLLPFFAEQFGAKDIASMHDAHALGTRLMAFLMFPACFGMAAIMPALLPLIYGHQFAGAVPAAQILVIAAALGAATVGANIVSAMERTDFVFFSNLIGIALSVAAGFLVIPLFGPIGAAWSRAVTQLILVALGQWFIARQLAFPLPYAALARLFIAAVLSAATARLTLMIVPGNGGIPTAIVVGTAVYLGTVRAIGALPRNDAERLASAVRSLSGGLGRYAGPIVNLVAR